MLLSQLTLSGCKGPALVKDDTLTRRVPWWNLLVAASGLVEALADRDCGWHFVTPVTLSHFVILRSFRATFDAHSSLKRDTVYIDLPRKCNLQIKALLEECEVRQ